MIYLDFGSEYESFTTAAARGLRRSPKRISSKFFYDSRGSELFEQICEQPEYYPTRTETLILHQNIREISDCFQGNTMLIEFGSGASIKTRILLDHSDVRTYVPLDISKLFLFKTAEELRRRYPALSIIPACGDFSGELKIPPFLFGKSANRVAFLPGSTLGNFDPIEAARILRSISDLLGTGYLLLGVDLAKDQHVLESAYNDAAGVTASFNKNLIHRLRDEAGVKINPDDFSHEAFFNPKLSRIEMHLRALRNLEFELAGERFLLEKDEAIHTENSYKYSPRALEALCQDSGLELDRYWTDPKEWFGVFLLRVRCPEAAEAWAA